MREKKANKKKSNSPSVAILGIHDSTRCFHPVSESRGDRDRVYY